MDKRSLTALFLIFLVIVGGTMLRQVIAPPPPVDTVALTTTSARPETLAAPTPAAATPTPPVTATRPNSPGSGATIGATIAAPAPVDEIVTVPAKGRELKLSTVGAHLNTVTLTEYQDLVQKDGPVTLAPSAGPLVRYTLINGVDTIPLERIAFTKTTTPTGVEFVATNPQLRIRYDADSVNYLTHATLSLAGAAPDARLLITLAPNLTSGEADNVEDVRNLAYSYRPLGSGVESTHLAKLDSMETIGVPGPLEWVAVRNKYFLFAVMSPDSTRAFSSLIMRGGRPAAPDNRPTGIATASLPLTGGEARFDMYTGPQSWQVLRSVGHELSNVNPYGWAWIRPVVEPFATIVMRSLLGMKAMLGLSYGWVLVVFGLLVRLLLWPLNQTAMRTSIKMQALQPELQALQKRNAKDPEAQRAAMMKLYAEHGMSPFSPLMGCLPMLIPMPILMALYFVFQNTIEFRGVPFLWLPDISMKDPLYITPIVMGVSMLVLSLIGMRAGPPNPQAKIMGYMMPVMFTVMFLNFASGLNMYYAVQNLIAIPQQWLLTRERARAQGSAVVKGPPAKKPRR
jgi:YidC/Oxa1 family membrane protein insertase